MKLSKIIALILSILLIFSMLAGCAATEESNPVDNSAAPEENAPEAEEDTSSEPESSGNGEITIRFARPEEIATFDPLNNNALVNDIHNRIVYDCLLGVDAEGNLSTSLAKSYEISEDNLDITFYLVEGVKFHNGDEMTAHDVAVSFNRLCEEDCTLTQLSNFAALESVEEVDDYTVIFHLNEPNAYILTLLAKFPVINGKLFEEMGEACFDLNIGTGPYKFVEWKPGVSIEYELNTEYWQEQKTNVEHLFYIPLMEDTTRVSALRTGDVDIIDSIPTESIEVLESEGLNIHSLMSSDQLYIGYQFENSVMADKNVRLAFAHAIDREAIAAEILGSGRAANFAAGEGCKGFDPDYPLVTYDPELAKELLADSSYNGEEIRVIGPTANYEKITETMTAIYHYLTAVGFNVNMEQLENAAFSDARKSGQYDCYIVGAAYGDGDGYGILNQRIVGDSLSSHYNNEELNNMILASNQIMDAEERNAALQEIYTKIMDDCAPFGYIVQYQFNYGYRDGLSGMVFNPSKYIDLTTIMVEE